jgi:hypothetical protein
LSCVESVDNRRGVIDQASKSVRSMSVSSSGDEEQESSSSSPSPLLTNDDDNDDDDDNDQDADASDQHEDTLISDEYGIHPVGSIFDIPPMFGNKNGDPTNTAEDQDATSEQESPLCSAESNKQVPHHDNRSRQQSILMDSAAHWGPLETTTGSTGNTHSATMNNSSNEAMDNETSSMMMQRTHATGSAAETQLCGLLQIEQQHLPQQQQAVANPTPFNWLSHLAAVAAAAPDTRPFSSATPPLGRESGPSSSQHFQSQTLPQCHPLLLPQQQLQPQLQQQQQQQQQQQVLPFFLQHPSTNSPLLVPSAMIPQLLHPAAKLPSHQFPLVFMGGGGNMINYNNNYYYIAATKPSPVTGNHPFIMPSFTMAANTHSLSSPLSTTRGIVSPPGVIATNVAASCFQHYFPPNSSSTMPVPTPLTLLPGRKGASTRPKHANVAVGSIEPFPVSRHW